MKSNEEYLQIARATIQEKIEEETIELNNHLLIKTYLIDQIKNVDVEINNCLDKIQCLQKKEGK